MLNFQFKKMAYKVDDIAALCNEVKNSPHIITQIAVIESCGVTAIPALDDYDAHANTPTGDPHTISGNLTLKSGYAFRKWNFRGKSEASYSDEITGDRDAETVTARVNGFIPNIREAADYSLCRPNGDWIVLAWDRNNANPFIIGEIGNGCRLNVRRQTSPKNGYVIELVAENLDIQPPRYAGTITYGT